LANFGKFYDEKSGIPGSLWLAHNCPLFRDILTALIKASHQSGGAAVWSILHKSNLRRVRILADSILRVFFVVGRMWWNKWPLIILINCFHTKRLRVKILLAAGRVTRCVCAKSPKM
jgi:hypothetical protein